MSEDASYWYDIKHYSSVDDFCLDKCWLECGCEVSNIDDFKVFTEIGEGKRDIFNLKISHKINEREKAIKNIKLECKNGHRLYIEDVSAFFKVSAYRLVLKGLPEIFTKNHITKIEIGNILFLWSCC